jgi:uncharacterized membrane protein YhaH (DUF805 family)
MNYYLMVLKKYAVFSGRSGRKEFWMFVLVNILIMVGIGIIENMAGLAQESGSGGPISGLYSLAVLIPSLAVAVRRLHDTNRSGWNILWGLIPLVGAIVLIVFYAQEGQAVANQYGPNPKEATPLAPTAQAPPSSPPAAPPAA